MIDVRKAIAVDVIIVNYDSVSLNQTRIEYTNAEL